MFSLLSHLDENRRIEHDLIRQPVKKREERLRQQKHAQRFSSSSDAADALDTLDLPPFSMEQSMRTMFGGGSSKKDQAQDLAYRAMQEREPFRAGALARKALSLDPDCIDAKGTLAQLTAASEEDLIEKYNHLVTEAERALGRNFFAENKGHFWLMLETRPYMRHRLFLTQRLLKAGRTKDAIGHMETLLELNPKDNQGIRDILIGAYLLIDDLIGARKLLKKYEDAGATFLFARVLERFLSGELIDAAETLTKAEDENSFAADYLSGKKALPKQLPNHYGFGDENEAIVCAVNIGEAWRRHPSAVKWLVEKAN